MIYAISQLGTWRVGTKYMSEISFVSSAQMATWSSWGWTPTSSAALIVLRCQARNMVTGKTILSIEKIVMVGLDEHGRPLEHGYHEPTDTYERIPERQVLAEEPLFAPVAAKVEGSA